MGILLEKLTYDVWKQHDFVLKSHSFHNVLGECYERFLELSPEHIAVVSICPETGDTYLYIGSQKSSSGMIVEFNLDISVEEEGERRKDYEIFLDLDEKVTELTGPYRN